ERAEGIRLREPLDREARDARDGREPLDAGIAVAARRDELLLQLIFVQTRDQPEAEAHSVAPAVGRLQCAVPFAEIDVDATHLDAVLARVAHELRRLIEAHRLAVDDGGAEDVGIVALDPGRGIDEQREARSMAFGEAVFAKAFDLAEAVLGESA